MQSDKSLIDCGTSSYKEENYFAGSKTPHLLAAKHPICWQQNAILLEAKTNFAGSKT